MDINPIIILFNNGRYEIVIDESKRAIIPLEQGFMINSSHYGFVVANSIESARIAKPIITHEHIVAIGTESGYLKVFEYGKKNPWIFRNGVLLKGASKNDSLLDSNIDDIFIATDNYGMFGERAKMDSPIHIIIGKNSKNSRMILDRGTSKERSYSINPAAFLGGEHYGFTIIKESSGAKKSFPTQKRIDALGIEIDDTIIKVYEDTKWKPWEFTTRGKLLKRAQYLTQSKKDLEAVKQYLEKNRDRTLNIKSL